MRSRYFFRGQLAPVAAGSSGTQGADPRQVVWFILHQARVIGQRAQFGELLGDKRLDFGDFVDDAGGAGFGFELRPEVDGAVDVFQFVGVVVVGHGYLLLLNGVHFERTSQSLAPTNMAFKRATLGPPLQFRGRVDDSQGRVDIDHRHQPSVAPTKIEMRAGDPVGCVDTNRQSPLPICSG